MSEIASSPFCSLLGNERVKQFLLKLYDSNRVGNSLLFAGPEGVGKSLFATAFAKLLLGAYPTNENALLKIEHGSHPDLRQYRPEGKLALHSVDTLRQFSKEAFDTPFEAPRRVFIFHDAERMQAVSANALLKTFEEPALDSIIILLSSSVDDILPTIRSRCRVVPFTALTQEDVAHYLCQHRAKNLEEAQAVAALAQGSLGRALRFVDGKGEEMRHQVIHLLAHGKQLTIPERLEIIKAIADYAETEEPETDRRDDLTAHQRDHMQKEHEGFQSMKKYQHLQAIFEIILSWHRDLALLQHRGEAKHLLNPDKFDQLQSSLQDPIEIDKLYQTIEEAQFSLQRSTGLGMVLETLFLKLL